MIDDVPSEVEKNEKEKRGAYVSVLLFYRLFSWLCFPPLVLIVLACQANSKGYSVD
jgi:hypothetical protein